MSKGNGDSLRLEGTGAAYIRVSTDQQDTIRQLAAVRAFEERHGVTIAKQHWYEDQGWARDKADTRPQFQQMIKLVESKVIRWIVVDALDRFGTKNSKQLISYLYRLEEAGCKLYDCAGKEWTSADIGTTITAVVEGENSKKEQTGKSHRVLGGKAEKARAGEWQGGPVHLGFDVACFNRATKTELWRVVFEDHFKRLKVYPDGRTERFDGKGNFPAWQKKGKPPPEFMQIVPSKDKAKVKAVVNVFKRYAAESISFTALAHYLNELNFQRGFGGVFHGHHVGGMLANPIYMGYYAWNKSHSGKFHRFKDGRQVAELNYEEHWSKNDKADWVQSHRLFKPLVDQTTWNAVQQKLETWKKEKRTNAPRSAQQYLAGIVYCGNCGGRMVAGSVKRGLHYFCGTYHRAVREGNRAECKCLRNAVRQELLEVYIDKYLEETGKRLALITGGEADPLTDQLEGQESETWRSYEEGLARLETYLIEHHPDEYKAIRGDYEAIWRDEQEARRQAEAGPAEPSKPNKKLDESIKKAAKQPSEPESGIGHPFFTKLFECYRANFDPTKLAAELDQLEAKLAEMVEQWADLPTPLAKEKAKERLAKLEERITGLRQQQQDVGEVVEEHYRALVDLQGAIKKAKIAMKAGNSERALRQKAQEVRNVVQRIECTFIATECKNKSGPGNANARLATVTIYPLVGDQKTYDVLQGTSVHSL